MFRDGDPSERIAFGPFYFILTPDSNHGGTFGEHCDYSPGLGGITICSA